MGHSKKNSKDQDLDSDSDVSFDYGAAMESDNESLSPEEVPERPKKSKHKKSKKERKREKKEKKKRKKSKKNKEPEPESSDDELEQDEYDIETESQLEQRIQETDDAIERQQNPAGVITERKLQQELSRQHQAIVSEFQFFADFLTDEMRTMKDSIINHVDIRLDQLEANLTNNMSGSGPMTAEDAHRLSTALAKDTFQQTTRLFEAQYVQRYANFFRGSSDMNDALNELSKTPLQYGSEDEYENSNNTSPAEDTAEYGEFTDDSGLPALTEQERIDEPLEEEPEMPEPPTVRHTGFVDYAENENENLDGDEDLESIASSISSVSDLSNSDDSDFDDTDSDDDDSD